MKKAVVTGGAGRLGNWVIKDLLAHGYEVICVDQNKPSTNLCHYMPVDLSNLGEVYGVLQHADAVIHLAGIPAPGMRTPEYTFKNNTITTFNVLEAASVLGVQKTVIASSESIYGIAFSVKPINLLYVPVDEEHPFQISEAYGLSKQVNELTADMYHQKAGMQIVSLRFANILAPEEYEKFRVTIEDPESYKINFWSYVDIRDAASACRASIETNNLGAVALNITADDTLANMDTDELLRLYWPQITDVRVSVKGNALIYTNRKAKQLLNWKPAHSWRESITLSTS